MNAHDLELDISPKKQFTPKMIWEGGMPLIFRDVPESVKQHARALRDNGWRFYSVKQSRGRCYYDSKVITIPIHAIMHRDIGYKIYYISHELAHASIPWGHHHDAVFMAKLIEICPAEYVHYELGYKPRNAASAGIGQFKLIDF